MARDRWLVAGAVGRAGPQLGGECFQGADVRLDVGVSGEGPTKLPAGGQ